MTERNSDSPEGGFNRRRAMKTLLGAAVASPVAFSSAAEAKEQSNPPKQSLNKVKRAATSQEVSNFVNSKILRVFLKRLRIPQVESKSAEVTEVRLGSAQVAKSIEIQTKYGTISGVLGDGSTNSLIFVPEDEKIPRGLKKQYSGAASWQDGCDTYITNQGPEQPIVFTRETTDEEMERVTKAALSSGAPGQPSQTLVTTTTGESSKDKLKLESDSEIWALYEKSTYRFDYMSTSILSQQRTGELFAVGSSGGISTQEVTCDDQLLSCAADLVTSFPNCILASVGCSLSTVAAGGCVLIVLAICVPGGALAVYSCATWCQNCSPDC